MSSEAWEKNMLAQLQLLRAESSAPDTISASGNSNDNNNASLRSFIAELQNYQDFVWFGKMMEDTCQQLYGGSNSGGGTDIKGSLQMVVFPPDAVTSTPLANCPSDTVADTDTDTAVIPAGHDTRSNADTDTATLLMTKPIANINDSSSSTASINTTPMSSSTGSSGSLRARYVRVLWDIENIPPLTSRQAQGLSSSGHSGAGISGTSGTLLTVLLLEQFLLREGLAGPGVDTRITTFVNFLDIMQQRRDRGRDTGGGVVDSIDGNGASTSHAAGDHGGLPQSQQQQSQQQSYVPISRQVLFDLDKANVEIVFASKCGAE